MSVKAKKQTKIIRLGRKEVIYHMADQFGLVYKGRVFPFSIVSGRGYSGQESLVQDRPASLKRASRAILSVRSIDAHSYARSSCSYNGYYLYSSTTIFPVDVSGGVGMPDYGYSECPYVAMLCEAIQEHRREHKAD